MSLKCNSHVALFRLHSVMLSHVCHEMIAISLVHIPHLISIQKVYMSIYFFIVIRTLRIFTAFMRITKQC